MPLHLYELTEQYRRLADWSDETGEDLSQYLDALEGDIASKAEGICKVLAGWQAEQAAYDAEAKRLSERSSTLQGQVYALKVYLQQNMEAAGLDRLKAGVFSVWLQNSPYSCEVHDVDQVPEQFKERVVTWKIDRKGIIDHFRATGQMLVGTTISLSRHLRIR